MSVKIDKIRRVVEAIEKQYEIYSPDDEKSVSILNLLINSVEVTLAVVKEADINTDQIEVLDKLSERVLAVKEKAG